MSTAYVVATVVAVAVNVYAATVDVVRPAWLLDNMGRLGIPLDRLALLGGLKAAGATGLLVGLATPVLGVAAGVGLVLYFVGAVTVVVRTRCYEQLPYPLVFLAVAAVALALRLATL